MLAATAAPAIDSASGRLTSVHGLTCFVAVTFLSSWLWMECEWAVWTLVRVPAVREAGVG